MNSCSVRQEVHATKANVTGPTARLNVALPVMLSFRDVKGVESVTSTTLVNAMTLLPVARLTICAQMWSARPAPLSARTVSRTPEPIQSATRIRESA